MRLQLRFKASLWALKSKGWPHDLPVLSAGGRSLFRCLHPLRILLLGCYSIAACLLQRTSRLYRHSLVGRDSCWSWLLISAA